jgi:hypothetical protein
MGRPIHRFVLACRPAPTNRSYLPWQTAELVVFVADHSKPSAWEKLNELLVQHRWLLIETKQRATLYKDRVQEAGGEMWKAYQVAEQRGYWIQVFSNHFAPGKKPLAVLMPRLGERFFDQMVELAGGRRLSTEERNNDQTRNADYRLDDFIIELKDIQEEGMEKPERQQKVAELFLPYFPAISEIIIDPSILSSDDRRRYLEIIGEPISRSIKSAAEQIKATKTHLRAPALRGGILVVNTGYYSLEAEMFNELVRHSARHDTRQIELITSINLTFTTDGFNSHMIAQVFPKESGLPAERRLVDAFPRVMDKHMTEMVTSGPVRPEDATPVPTPISFNYKDRLFRFMPVVAPRWTPDSM